MTCSIEPVVPSSVLALASAPAKKAAVSGAGTFQQLLGAQTEAEAEAPDNGSRETLQDTIANTNTEEHPGSKPTPSVPSNPKLGSKVISSVIPAVLTFLNLPMPLLSSVLPVELPPDSQSPSADGAASTNDGNGKTIASADATAALSPTQQVSASQNGPANLPVPGATGVGSPSAPGLKPLVSNPQSPDSAEQFPSPPIGAASNVKGASPASEVASTFSTASFMQYPKTESRPDPGSTLLGSAKPNNETIAAQSGTKEDAPANAASQQTTGGVNSPSPVPSLLSVAAPAAIEPVVPESFSQDSIVPANMAASSVSDKDVPTKAQPGSSPDALLSPQLSTASFISAIVQPPDQAPTEPGGTATPAISTAAKNLSASPSLKTSAQVSPATASVRVIPDFSSKPLSPGISQHTHRDPDPYPSAAPPFSSRIPSHSRSPSGYLDANLMTDSLAAGSASSLAEDTQASSTQATPIQATATPMKGKGSQSNGSAATQPGGAQPRDPTSGAGLSDTPPATPSQAAAISVAPVPVQPTPDHSPSIPAAPEESSDLQSADQAPVLATTPSPQDTPAPAPIGPVQAAQIVTRATQSEMRIGLNTVSFGSVEVRTVVHANDVGILIGSERGDLRSLLSSELPAIATSLQQHDLRLNQVSFHQGFGFSSQTPSGGGSQPRYFAPKAKSASALPQSFSNNESGTAAEARPSPRSTGLSILA